MTTTCRGGRSRAGQLFGGHVRDRPGCQGCWYPEWRKEMDAAVASETRITAATIPCSGAFTSGADAAQGSSSGGQICSYNCCGFAAPRVSHWEKWVTIFRTIFRGLSNAAEQKLKPKIVHLFSNPAHFFKIICLADTIQRLEHFGAGATTCKPAPHRDAVWWSSTSMKPM